MTIPMTPPVDGGPELDTCPWCGGPIRYDYNRRLDALDTDPIEPSNVWLGCCNEECPVQPMTAGYETTEEADEAWATRRPATTRDAALREEGRVQGLEMAVKWCEAEQSVWAAQVGAYAKGSRNALVAKVRENAMKGAAAELRLLASTPDASQGSALDQPATVVCEDCEEDYSFQCDLCGDRFCGEHATQHKADKCPALAPPAAPQGSPLPGGGDSKMAGRQLGPDELCPGSECGHPIELHQCIICYRRCGVVAPGNPPEGGALEGEMAEALRSLVFNNRCSRLLCEEDCRCDIGRGKRALARYDASKAIPQSGDEKEGT